MAPVLSVLLAATALLACGGDDDDARPPATSKPATTSTTEAPSRAPTTTQAPAATTTTTGVAPASPAAAGCGEADILPVLVAELGPDSPVHVVGADVQECTGGYAHAWAVPDNATCGQAGGSCYDEEQFFLQDVDGRWQVVTAGTGISCQDLDRTPALARACAALGLSGPAG